MRPAGRQELESLYFNSPDIKAPTAAGLDQYFERM